MAKVTLKMFQDSEDNEPITPLDVIQGKNLKPPYGIVTASQPIELADQEGNIIKRSNADESSSKKTDSNLNGCGQDVTEQYLKSD